MGEILNEVTTIAYYSKGSISPEWLMTLSKIEQDIVFDTIDKIRKAEHRQNKLEIEKQNALINRMK